MMDNRGTEQAWQDIQARVDELLRQSLAGNFFYRLEYGPGREAGPPDAAGESGEENHAGKPLR